MNLRIEQIRTDGGTQARAELSISDINDYAEAMRGGAVFPAIVVFYDGKTYWLADGFHRVQAAISAEKKELAADVRQGTQGDAVWFSCAANANNSIRRTNEDKRRAVMTALAHPNATSDGAIAVHCGVSQPFVSKLRPATHNGYESTERVGLDGRTINTANIGKTKPTKVEEPEDDEDADEAFIVVDGDEEPEAPVKTNYAPNWNPPLTSSLEDNDAVFAAGKVAIMVQRWRKELSDTISAMPLPMRVVALDRASSHFVALVSDIVERIPKLRGTESARPALLAIKGGKS